MPNFDRIILPIFFTKYLSHSAVEVRHYCTDHSVVILKILPTTFLQKFRQSNFFTKELIFEVGVNCRNLCRSNFPCKFFREIDCFVKEAIFSVKLKSQFSLIWRNFCQVDSSRTSTQVESKCDDLTDLSQVEKYRLTPNTSPNVQN